jgi:hypothetical protein
LHRAIDKIRENYQIDWKSKEMRTRQRAVALYFIDKVIQNLPKIESFYLSIYFSLHFGLEMKKMKMKQILWVVVHYVLNMLNYSIKSMALERMLLSLIFSAKIVSGKYQ